MNQSPQLGDLPPEIHRSIFSFLSWKDADRMACVSKYWQKLNQDMLFTKIDNHYIRLDCKIVCMETIGEKLNTEINAVHNIDEKLHFRGPFCQALYVFLPAQFIIAMTTIIWSCFTDDNVATIVGVIALGCLWIGIILFLILGPLIKKIRVHYKKKAYKAHIAHLIEVRDLLSEELKNLRQRKNEV